MWHVLSAVCCIGILSLLCCTKFLLNTHYWADEIRINVLEGRGDDEPHSLEIDLHVITGVGRKTGEWGGVPATAAVTLLKPGQYCRDKCGFLVYNSN